MQWSVRAIIGDLWLTDNRRDKKKLVQIFLPVSQMARDLPFRTTWACIIQFSYS